ncbi:hypothetical protein APHAL10511_005326 [Amanita phalloides]|nr:hypothetical protein APHAL10511_005326 [Amanita phalloides]
MTHPPPFEDVSMSDPPYPDHESLALVRPSPIRPRQGPTSAVRRTQSPIDRPSIIPSTRLSPDTNGSEFSPAAHLSAPDAQVFSHVDGRSSSRVSKPSPPIHVWGKSTQRHLPTESKVEPIGKEFVAVYQSIRCGDEECIEYPVSTLPSSMLPEDDEGLFKELPATEPPLGSITIEVPSIPYVFDVGPSPTGLITVWDVLEAIYQKRDQFGDQWFQGLSGLSWTKQKLRLQLHLTNTN